MCPKRLYNGNYNTLHYFTFELLITKGIFYMLSSAFLCERFCDNYFFCQAITGIAESWEQITLDIGPYKDRGHFRLKYEFTITLDRKQTKMN